MLDPFAPKLLTPSQDFFVMHIVLVFFKNFPHKKALLLHGPAGTGKTSLAYALAKEKNLEILELNASDLRNKEKLGSILRPASQQQSLFGNQGKIILVDEVDGITVDRGGLPELIALIEKTSFPIIITANNIWQQKFNLLRKKVELVKLKELHYDKVLVILKIAPSSLVSFTGTNPIDVPNCYNCHANENANGVKFQKYKGELAFWKSLGASEWYSKLKATAISIMELSYYLRVTVCLNRFK